MKICPKCEKPGEFTKDSARADGLSFYCKYCRRAERVASYKRDSVKVLAKNKGWRTENGAYMLWASARRRAKERGTPFTITVEDVTAVWPSDGRCPVLGIELKPGTGGGPTPASPSLDAFVPGLGYVPGNITVMSFLANGVKRDVTDPTVLERVADWIRSKIR